MNEIEATKVCPRCAETIKAAARKCPYCQSPQSQFALWRQEVAGAAVVLLFMGLFVAMAAWIDQDLGTKGRAFDGHQTDLSIGRVDLESAPKRSEFWVMGSVTNQGTYPWRIQEIEVRFLNPDGTLLDVQHPRVNDPFVVQPSQTGAFRFPLGRLPPAVAGARLQARVSDATDGNIALDPD